MLISLKILLVMTATQTLDPLATQFHGLDGITEQEPINLFR